MPRLSNGADFYIVTVPTPIDGRNRPDLGADAGGLAQRSARCSSSGDIVVYEFDGLSRRASRKTACRCWKSSPGLKAGSDFTVGYSPERINPGDKRTASRPS